MWYRIIGSNILYDKETEIKGKTVGGQRETEWQRDELIEKRE